MMHMQMFTQISIFLEAEPISMSLVFHHLEKTWRIFNIFLTQNIFRLKKNNCIFYFKTYMLYYIKKASFMSVIIY